MVTSEEVVVQLEKLIVGRIKMLDTLKSYIILLIPQLLVSLF